MRKADPLEERARALAIAAGGDPDSRVMMPDSARTMPAWCQFRTAARAKPVVRYFFHPESDSFFFTDDGSHPGIGDGMVQEIGPNEYIRATCVQRLAGSVAA